MYQYPQATHLLAANAAKLCTSRGMAPARKPEGPPCGRELVPIYFEGGGSLKPAYLCPACDAQTLDQAFKARNI